MKATGNAYHGIADVISTQAEVVVHKSAAFDGADDMFDRDPTSANPLVGLLLVVGQGLSFGFLVAHNRGITKILEQFAHRSTRITDPGPQLVERPARRQPSARSAVRRTGISVRGSRYGATDA